MQLRSRHSRSLRLARVPSACVHDLITYWLRFHPRINKKWGNFIVDWIMNARGKCMDPPRWIKHRPPFTLHASLLRPLKKDRRKLFTGCPFKENRYILLRLTCRLQPSCRVKSKKNNRIKFVAKWDSIKQTEMTTQTIGPAMSPFPKNGCCTSIPLLYECAKCERCPLAERWRRLCALRWSSKRIFIIK